MGRSDGGVSCRPKLLDGIDAFYAAYKDGRAVRPPQFLADYVLIPAILHTPTAIFESYPDAVKEFVRLQLPQYIASGMTTNPVIKKRR